MTAPILGNTQPRIYTPPRGILTPDTSDGFAVVDFARDVLKAPLDPWQAGLAIHALEKLPDGRPRFRRILAMLSRQAGKTHMLAVLSCWWLWRDPDVRLILGLSTTESMAKEAWSLALDLAENAGLDMGAIRTTNGQVEFRSGEGSRYVVKAANRRGGRGLSLDRALMDEVREHRNRDALDAVYPAMNARPRAQLWAITNAGDESSVVLWSLRDEALAGLTDPGTRFGLFEWSADPALAADDPLAWAQAQPQLGRRVDVDVYRAAAARAVAAGGEELSRFETEQLCRRVLLMDPAIDPARWDQCFADGTLEQLRDRVHLALDVAPDGQHATVVAAAVQADGRCRVEVVEAFDGTGAGDRLRRALPGLVSRVKPRTLGWLPGGPAAALADQLRPRQGRIGWPPAGVDVAEIRTDIASACMGLAEAVTAGTIVHAGDPLLDQHVKASERLRRSDGTWVFSRRGGHVDAAYATAAALWLARTAPTPVRVRKLLYVP